jgi:hypothetical protein
MYTVLLSLLLSTSSYAASLAGVSMSDTIVANSNTLQLNGMGLREKYWIDIYVAGLYLPEKMSTPEEIITKNIPKQIQIEFIYSSVPKNKMIEVLEENIQNNPQFSAETVASIRKCGTWMQDFTTGDVVSFDYVPSTQTTTIYINGTERGAVQSQEFMQAIFAMYVGKYPATQELKRGLLGL